MTTLINVTSSLDAREQGPWLVTAYLLTCRGFSNPSALVFLTFTTFDDQLSNPKYYPSLGRILFIPGHQLLGISTSDSILKLVMPEKIVV